MCTHHWKIAPPEGPFSKGFCIRCGAEQDFQNYITYSAFEPKKDKLDRRYVMPKFKREPFFEFCGAGDRVA